MEFAPVGIDVALIDLDVEVVGSPGGSGDECHLRELGGSDRVHGIVRQRRAVEREMTAAGRNRVVVEEVGQRVAVEIGGAEQAGGRQSLAGIDRQIRLVRPK